MQVKAPRTGTIQRRTHGEGSELVKAGDLLAVLVPDTESRAVELHIIGNDIPLVREGQQVRLQFEGWPAIQFSGWPELAAGTFGGVVTVISPTDEGGNGKFRILVSPDPRVPDGKWPPGELLRQGVRANGWVLMGRVSVGYELWRRFNGFPPVFPESPANKDKEKKK
jgi:adhesin transport system membrane fusion protein